MSGPNLLIEHWQRDLSLCQFLSIDRTNKFQSLLKISVAD